MKQTITTDPNQQNSGAQVWRYPTLIEQESEIEWLYHSAMFPVLRVEWMQVVGRGRIPLRWRDNRLVVAMSRLGYEVDGDVVERRKRNRIYFLRRMFYLLPRDIYLIRAHLQKVCVGYRMPIPEMPTRSSESLLPSSIDWVARSSVWPGEEHRLSTWECYERMAPYFAANLAVVLMRWQREQDEKRDDARIRQQRTRSRQMKDHVTKAKSHDKS